MPQTLEKVLIRAMKPFVFVDGKGISYKITSTQQDKDCTMLIVTDMNGREYGLGTDERSNRLATEQERRAYYQSRRKAGK